MLALITEKLQNQSLQDAASASAAASTGTKFPQLSREDTLRTSTSQAQSGLAVKGKNVWSVSERDGVESEKGGLAGGGGGGKVARIAGDKLHCSVQCRHKKSTATCPICDCVPGTPTAPPKKKHCHSLSVPLDAPPEAPRLWRPIAVIPITNNNIQHKNRNLVGRLPSDFKVVGSGQTLGTGYPPGYTGAHGHGGSGGTFPSLAPSPLSSDSGHFTVSDLTTPPGSPVPRPASVASDTSHHSPGSPWLDQSPYRINRFEVLQNRSLSCEDNILSACVVAGSTPCVAGGATSSSNPASPCRHRIPRCRSQPCVLHERKCGKKRRRVHTNRPALNFQKMAETAYVQLPQSDPVQVPVSEYEKGMCRFRLEPESCLMPIASSPIDTEASPAAKRSNHCPSPLGDLRHAAGVALPPTPPQTFHFPHRQFIPADPSGEEEEEEDSECGCHGDQMEDGTELFPLADLDLEQIENH